MTEITKEELQTFRMLLLDDIKRLISAISGEEKPEWIKSAEVRKMLKVSPGTLQNLRVSGKLNPKKVNGSWYYSMGEIKKLFK